MKSNWKILKIFLMPNQWLNSNVGLIEKGIERVVSDNHCLVEDSREEAVHDYINSETDYLKWKITWKTILQSVQEH